MVLTAQNGIPWWYFFKHGGPFEGRRLESVDPGGVIAAHLPVERVIACVVYPAAEIVAPGVIRHIEGNRFSVAEIDNSKTRAHRGGRRSLRKAGFKAPVVTDIRSEIWTKLWGNLSFNPISALTHATLEDICRFALTRELAAGDDARGAGGRRGARHHVPHFARKAHRRRRGRRRPQDLDAAGCRGGPRDRGRRAARLGRSNSAASSACATPHIDAIYALVKLLGETLGAARRLT